MLAKKLYYSMKPMIPRPVQVAMRQILVGRQLKSPLNNWPISQSAGKKPQGWPGWPGGVKFALVLTHDVESEAGQEKCIRLKDLEQSLGFRSSFNFVPERYTPNEQVHQALKKSGFEVGVHGLNHDGKLYNSRQIFSERAIKINHYLKEWGAFGFRSPAMHHNLEWLHDLNIEYDCSTFDTDPFEPQSDGVDTIFPFYVESKNGSSAYYELPYTLPQDFTLFVLMKQKTTDIWKNKLDWIRECGGMVLMNTHPDYMNFGDRKLGCDEYHSELYIEFLEYVKKYFSGDYCNLLPCELVSYLSDQQFRNSLDKTHCG